jgi:urocanate hydratase
VSGTDSPYRETSNIEDGSAFTAGKWFPKLKNNIEKKN